MILGASGSSILYSLGAIRTMGPKRAVSDSTLRGRCKPYRSVGAMQGKSYANLEIRLTSKARNVCSVRAKGQVSFSGDWNIEGM